MQWIPHYHTTLFIHSFTPSSVTVCRIIEIEWAVKNNKPFKASPKKPKRKKTKKASRDEKRTSSTTEAPAVVLKDSRDENSNSNMNVNSNAHAASHGLGGLNGRNAEQPFGSSLLIGSVGSSRAAEEGGETTTTSMLGGLGGLGVGVGVGGSFGSYKRQAEGWETPKKRKKMRSSSIADGVGSASEGGGE